MSVSRPRPMPTTARWQPMSSAVPRLAERTARLRAINAVISARALVNSKLSALASVALRTYGIETTVARFIIDRQTSMDQTAANVERHFPPGPA